MIEKTGDLFSTNSPYIGHGVNVDGKMGAGIAVQFRNRFPKMHEQYVLQCEAGFLKVGGVMPFVENGKVIFNIASQDRPGPNAWAAWLYNGLFRAAMLIPDKSHPIAIPRIGCGIGGLEWETVRDVIRQVEHFTSTEVEVWTLPS